MKIAIIDDQADIRYAVEKMLSNQGHTCYGFSGAEEDLIEGIDVFDIDLIILDMMLGENLTGIDVLQKIKDASYQIPTILITAYTTPSNLINASKSGIVDIIEKPFSTKDLLEVVDKYKKDDKKSKHFVFKDDKEEFIGSFETMKDVYSKIGIAAKSYISVSIFGETGTGKELVSKLIHKNSPKAASPFVAINCANVSEEKFESQFYGENDKKGYASLVGEGTLFLDEISELKPSIQSKLLRFLELKTYTPIGETKDRRFNGRIICASSINPKELVEKHTFRNDLYHRISMLEIELPNLTQRKNDIKDLIYHFIKLANLELNTNIKNIDKDAAEFLKSYKFSGNIRELKNSIFKAALIARNDKIILEDIKDILQSEVKTKDFSMDEICKKLVNIYGVENAKNILEDIEQGVLKELMSRCQNNSKLSIYLGISRNTLKAKIQKFKIQPLTPLK
jgi:DNA-binding NtrC family response regulator